MATPIPNVSSTPTSSLRAPFRTIRQSPITAPSVVARIGFINGLSSIEAVTNVELLSSRPTAQTMAAQMTITRKSKVRWNDASTVS